MNPIQRKFGYCELYNTLAPCAGIYIQNRKFTFKYDNKIWRIWLWKGQYGAIIGAEVGIYIYSKTYKVAAFGKTYKQQWYRSANNSERLKMSLTLYKNNIKLFSRPAQNHWWLTGFKPGIKSKKDVLKMSVTITFKSLSMAKAFCKAAKLPKPTSSTVSFKW